MLDNYKRTAKYLGSTEDCYKIQLKHNMSVITIPKEMCAIRFKDDPDGMIEWDCTVYIEKRRGKFYLK